MKANVVEISIFQRTSQKLHFDFLLHKSRLTLCAQFSVPACLLHFDKKNVVCAERHNMRRENLVKTALTIFTLSIVAVCFVYDTIQIGACLIHKCFKTFSSIAFT